MQPLELIRQTLFWLCIYSPSSKPTRWKKVARILFTSLILIRNAAGLMASTVFCIKSISTDIEKVLNTFGLVAGLISMTLTITMVLAIVRRHKFTNGMQHLLKIYETSERHFQDFIVQNAIKLK